MMLEVNRVGLSWVMYLQDIKGLMRTAHITVRCDANLSPACQGEFATLLHRAERNKSRWGRHVCRACAPLAKRGGLLQRIDPDWCKGNQFDTIEEPCNKCGTKVRAMRGTMRTSWRLHGCVLCHVCRPRQKAERPFTRRRVRSLARQAVAVLTRDGAGGQLPRNISYEPLKAPPPPSKRCAARKIQSADMVAIACRMDLDPRVLFWRFIDNDSILFVTREDGPKTASRFATNGQMPLEKVLQESLTIVKKEARG